MFCTSLRRRSSFASVLSSLTSPPLKLKESQLTSHDIALPLAQSPTHLVNSNILDKRSLRFLLLSPSCTSDTHLATTLSRIHHFAALTGGKDVALVFLLRASSSIVSARSMIDPPSTTSDGMRAYAKLQAELLVLHDFLSIPILPLTNPAGLENLLISYLEGVSKPIGIRNPVTTATAIDLLESCTTEPPLAPFAVDLVTDLFPSFAEFAAEATSKDESKVGLGERTQWTSSSCHESTDEVLRPGFAGLRAQLDEGTVEGMIAFWQEEWAVE